MRLDQESFRFLYKLIWSMPPHADIIAAIHDSPLSMTKMEQLKSVSTFKALAEGRTVLFTESIPHLNLLDGNDFEEQWQEKLKLFYLWQMEELWVELKMDNTRMSVRDQLIGVFLHGYHHFFIHVLVKTRPHRLIKPFKDYLSAKMIEKRAADENVSKIIFKSNLICINYYIISYTFNF
jgi:hypothetical protein